ncbi:OmpH family outer membrane protein [candidate division KSB1 bacterium]|nr:OmpH family outer membrane protein [candidate division KSB1 bacterium]
MTFRNFMRVIGILGLVLIFGASAVFAQKSKIGYVNSEKIKAEYKESQDAQKKIEEINAQWEKEAVEKQKEIQGLQEQLETQSLLLSEEKKREKYQELQVLAQKFEQFKAQKWGQQGEIFRKQEEIWKPIQDKIFAVINKVGEQEGYDFIFDSALNVFLYIDSKQPDLTPKVLEELNKGLTTGK